MRDSERDFSNGNLCQTEGSRRSARICMPTWRKFIRKAARGGLYQAQDVLQSVNDVDLVCVEARRGFLRSEKLLRRLARRDISGRLIFTNPRLKRVRLKQEYELFIAVCQDFSDLFYVNAIEGWKDQCKVSVCYIDELWASSVPGFKHWIHALRRFDHVVLGLSGSVNAVSAAIGRPCHFVPGGVDAIRFSPYPQAPLRPIDVYSIGRKSEGVHQSLLTLAARKEIFYVYDTVVDAGDMQLLDYRQHRDLLANIAKRSRYFVVGPAKMGVSEETKGLIEIGYRYFEGAAAGAVLIGQAPDCDTFRELFNWPDAVIEIQTDGSDVAEVLSRLAAQPDRVYEIGRRNASEALLRHDWVYRWKQILDIAGLKPQAAMDARVKRLKELAEIAEQGNQC
jgi:hypothetical protein